MFDASMVKQPSWGKPSRFSVLLENSERNQGTTKSPINKLPIDLGIVIASYLTNSSIEDLKGTSSDWNQIICDLKFQRWMLQHFFNVKVPLKQRKSPDFIKGVKILLDKFNKHGSVVWIQGHAWVQV